MSSWMRTVLPTPAPPKSRSCRDVRGDEVDDLDAGLERLDLRREIAELRRVAVDRPALRVGRDRLGSSIGSPITFQSRPTSARRRGRRSVPSVSTQTTPRREPVVESMATARTRSSPRCCCTSATSVRDPSLPTISISSAVDLGEPVGEDCVDDDALISMIRPVFVRSDPFSDMVLLGGSPAPRGWPAGTGLSKTAGTSRQALTDPDRAAGTCWLS